MPPTYYESKNEYSIDLIGEVTNWILGKYFEKYLLNNPFENKDLIIVMKNSYLGKDNLVLDICKKS